MGPLALQPSDIIPLDGVTRDILNQGRYARYGEKEVDHEKWSGTISYLPQFADVVPAAQSGYPNRVGWNGKKVTESGSPYYSYLIDGVAWHGGTSFKSTYQPLYTNTAWEADGTSLTQYQIRTSSSVATTRSSATMVRYEVVSISATTVTLKSTQYNSNPSVPSSTIPGDWSKSRSWNEIISAVQKCTSGSAPQLNTSSYPLRVGATSSTMSVDAVKYAVGSTVVPILKRNFPWTYENYGSLAYQAAENLSPRNLNLIELIHDLHNPKEVIEMITNLGKIRGLRGRAGDYLSVHYGILPTISDLQKLWGRFHRMAPHHDRFGSQTASAGSLQTKTIGNVQGTLSQHAKIAIIDEDEGLVSIMDRLDTVGILPNLERIWDLVPYSFIIDWFLDVGGLLKRLDQRSWISRHKIRYVTMSCKESRSTTLSPTATSPWVGTVTWERYQRWVSDQCPTPPLLLSNNSTTSSHWLEAAALIIQHATK